MHEVLALITKLLSEGPSASAYPALVVSLLVLGGAVAVAVVCSLAVRFDIEAEYEAASHHDA